MAEEIAIAVPIIQVTRMRRFLLGVFRCTKIDDQGVAAKVQSGVRLCTNRS